VSPKNFAPALHNIVHLLFGAGQQQAGRTARDRMHA
jgi:hypothetical protein